MILELVKIVIFCILSDPVELKHLSYIGLIDCWSSSKPVSVEVLKLKISFGR